MPTHIHPTEIAVADRIVHIRDRLRDLAEYLTDADARELIFEMYCTLGYLERRDALGMEE